MYKARQTYSLGLQFTLSGIYAPAPDFHGPVNVVVGAEDFPFCMGVCNDQAAATIPALFPAAANGSQSYVISNCGHTINAHYCAQQGFGQINWFLQSNGF